MKKFKNINEDNKKNCVSHSKRQRNLTLFIITALMVAIAIAVVIVNGLGVSTDNNDNDVISETFMFTTTTTSTTTDVTYTSTSSVVTSQTHTTGITSTTSTTPAVDSITSTITSSTTVETTTIATTITTTNTTTIESSITEETIITEPIVQLLIDEAEYNDCICTVEEETDVITYECEVVYKDIVETTTVEEREYLVFKPGTHYVHRSTCRWFDDSCYEISSTDGIESRLCDECNPDIEIMTPYEESTVSYNDNGSYPIGSDGLPHAALNYVTEEERIYLCNTVAQEYGCDWISQYDKALVVAVVMNRLSDGGWQGYGRENNIYNILTAPYQFDPAYAVPYYRYNVTDSCITAVDYYFENMDSFPHYTSFYGDGSVNYFS